MGCAYLPRRQQITVGSVRSTIADALLQSFESPIEVFVCSLDARGISFFGWGSQSPENSSMASTINSDLLKLLLPSGYVEIGRPDTGDYDAVCFKLNASRQNREYRIVQADHEEIVCNSRIEIRREPWPGFCSRVEHKISPR
jgi:hypothetical protein